MALRVVDAQNLIVFEKAVEVEIGDDHLAWPEAAAVKDARGSMSTSQLQNPRPRGR